MLSADGTADMSHERTIKNIRRLYTSATPGTIERDLKRAVELLKSLPTEADHERAAVFMDGLSQMRSEWARRPRGPGSRGKKR